MYAKKILAAALATGALTLVGAGAASADTGSSSSTPSAVAPTAAPTPSTTVTPTPVTPAPGTPANSSCANAVKRVGHLKGRAQRVERRIDGLHRRDLAAKHAGHDDRAKILEARLDQAQTLHDRVVDRERRIAARCNVPAPAASTPPVSPTSPTPIANP